MSIHPQLDNVKAAITAGTTMLANSSDSPRLDAELLLGMALAKQRAWLYAHPESPLTGKQTDVFYALINQRATGRPMAHLTGVREFWSLEFAVDEHTLVPRPETELLVEQALACLPAGQPLRVLDLGTGSGAIAVALATERPTINITATDRSGEALAMAKHNAAEHCPERIRFFEGCWFDALPPATAPFDMIVTNPPYIGEAENTPTDKELDFEPVTALYSGKDGLDAIRQIIAATGPWLKPGGWLLLEHGCAQAAQVTGLLTAAGFESVDNRADLAGQPRVSFGQQS